MAMLWTQRQAQRLAGSHVAQNICETRCPRPGLLTRPQKWEIRLERQKECAVQVHRKVARHISKAAIFEPTETSKLVASYDDNGREISNLAVPGRLEELQCGVLLYGDGQTSVKLWAPHCAAVYLQRQPADYRRPDPQVLPDGDVLPRPAPPPLVPADADLFPLTRVGDHWATVLPPGVLKKGTGYQFLLDLGNGFKLERRDIYARQTDYESNWCYVDSPSAFLWQTRDWSRPNHDRYIIYELHVGSFTPEGSFAKAAEKLEHIQSLGFTAVQVMPIAEHSDSWGYNPRQFMSLHGDYGSPDEFRQFVDQAHSLGLAVIVDIVLHHGAVDGNAMWEYDGWTVDNNGGIYHEGAPDTEWGRGLAYWKKEVIDMATDTCRMYLQDYKVDGLRFDSANDLPNHVVQHLTWTIRHESPGTLMTAEITPEDPQGVHDLGLDALWVHSGYFDIIQQHRALGRGHHGGGDWAEGWNLPRLRTAMGLHYGFTSPTQCIKYLLGSHDQIGCRHGGKWYEDYIMIGGQHRYPVDQYGGGRGDPHARAAQRLWYGANVGAAGLPMVFMGTDVAQGGWWDTDRWHSMQWELAEDEIGVQMKTSMAEANFLRHQYPALRQGWCNVLHEDRPNGVMAFERVADGLERMVVVVNAGRGSWQDGEYGCWVGHGAALQEVYCSQSEAYGGWGGWKSNMDRGVLSDYDGKLYINLPEQCTLIFKQVYGE